MTHFKKLGALLAALLLAAGAAHAQVGKAINLMVPYPAGGPSDAAARIVSVPLGNALKEQVIVENLGGASGSIAAQKVLGAPADGRYILQGSPNEVILASLANAAVKIKAEDFRLVHPMTEATMVFVARKDLPANNVDELIALARKSADKPLNYGSVGVGSLYHFILEDVQQRTGVKLTHVPYKGNAPLLQDLGGGQVDFAVLVYSSAMGALAEQGRLKLIGQLGATRSPFLKTVPAAAESKELPKFEYTTWSGFFVPKATPDAVVDRLHQGIVTMLKDESVRSQFAVQMQTAAPQVSVAEAGKIYEAETARYRAIAKAINLQPQ